MNRLTSLCCAVALTVFTFAQSASAQCPCAPTEQDAVNAIAFAAASLAAIGSDWDNADSSLGNLSDAVEQYGAYNDHLDNGTAGPDAQLEADIESNIGFGQSALDMADLGADDTIAATNRLINALNAWGAGNYQAAIDHAILSDQSAMNASMAIGVYSGDLSIMAFNNDDLATRIAAWAAGGGMGTP